MALDANDNDLTLYAEIVLWLQYYQIFLLSFTKLQLL